MAGDVEREGRRTRKGRRWANRGKQVEGRTEVERDAGGEAGFEDAQSDA